MMRTTFIYALVDAEGHFDYVGQSRNPKRRFRDHKAAGIVLAEVPWEERKAQECRFIALFLAEGCLLRNKNKGGGGPGQHTLEACTKMSAAHKKRSPHSLETRAKMSATQKGKKRAPASLETRAKMSAVRKGKTHSLETRAKMSAAKKGKKFSRETRAKMSAVRKGKKRAPYSLEK